MKCRIFQVDAFTTERFSGNPAGVVFPADGLNDQQMVLLARELGNSETAFIMNDLQTVRYFTASQEVPLCTHATVASYHIMTTLLGLPCGKHTMQCKAGALSIQVEERSGHPLIAVRQNAATFGLCLSEHQMGLLEHALRISVGNAHFPVQWVSTGNPKILVPIENRKLLSSLKPDRSALIELGVRLGCPGFYCFTLDDTQEGVDAHARMFSPGSGIDEDPVTGNAAGALAVYLKRYGEHNRSTAVVIRQQDHAGRFGYINVQLDGEVPTITGSAVLVYEGYMDW